MADKKIFANEGPSKPEVPHSSYDLSHCNNLTARAGRIYPILSYLAPANSSFKIKPHVAFNMHSLAFPIQTNIRCHMSFYKIPLRILWKHFRDFESMIGSDGLPASSTNQYRIPYINREAGWHSQGSLADYMGIPSNVISETVNFCSAKRSRIIDCNFSTSPIRIDVEAPGSSLSYIRFTFPETVTPNSTRHYALLPCKDLALSENKKAIHIRFVGSSPSFSPTVQLFKSVPFAQSADNSHTPIVARYVPLGDAESCTLSNNYTIVTLANDYNLKDYTLTLHSNIVSSYLEAASEGVTDFALLVSSNAYGFGNEQNDPCLINHQGSQSVTQTHTDGDKDTIVTTTPPYGLFQSFLYPRKYTLTDNSIQTFSHNSAAGAPNNGNPFIPVSALPFRAYEFIYNYFFRNERISPFMKNNVPTYNEFLSNDGDGADSVTPITFFNAPYEYDLFTTCVKTPQFGNAPLVGISVSGDTAEFLMKNLTVESGGETTSNYSIGVTLDENQHITQISNYDEVADKPGVHRLQELISSGISINDFRNVNCLQRFLERHQKSGSKYQNVLYEFFGTNPPIGEEFPEYLGGSTVPINVSTVISQAGTDHAKLGDYVGLGQFRGSESDMISCFTSETCYIMGIMYFTITPAYSQMLPAHFAKSRLLDFYNPQFASIGLQPVYKYQLTPLQLSSTEITDVFGYNRPYADYVSCQDEVHGDFRGNMSNFLVQRIFGNAPDLGQDFIEIKSGDVTNVFSDTEDNDKFYGQIYFDFKAKLPIPKFSVPRII